MSLLFEWDVAKDRANYQKHRVTFAESRTIFNDPFLLTFPDEAHSQNEERFISIGATTGGQVLVVVHTERGQKIRLISSRMATNVERRVYEEER
jgi:uncharacterized protein